MPELFRIPALPAFLASGLLWLSGCASSSLPIAPMEKGESRHGVSLHTQASSAINYHYNAGLTEYLDLGLQAGMVNAGVSARLHVPTGRKTDWALTNTVLAYLDPGESWNGGPHYHLRWEGKLSLIRKTAWFDYALSPVVGAEVLGPQVEPDQPIGSTERVGVSLAIGGSRFGLEADWAWISGLPDWDGFAPNFYQHENDYSQRAQELALKLSWAWGGRSPKQPSRGTRVPATMPPDGPATPPSPDGLLSPPPSNRSVSALATPPVTDPLAIYGAAHCGADPEEFRLWLARDLDRLNLVQDALDAGKKRLRKAGLSGGGGLLLFLAGGGIAVMSILQATRWDPDLEEEEYPPAGGMLRLDPVPGGLIMGSLFMAAGTGFTLQSLYLLAFDSAAERDLTRAWEARVPEP